MSDELLREILREANRDELFRKALEEARDAGCMVEVHANVVDLEHSVIGFVHSVGLDLCHVLEIGETGLPDGLASFHLSDVRHIARDTRGLCRRRLLYENRARFIDLDPPAFLEPEDVSIEGHLHALIDARDSGAMVSVRIATEQDFRHVNGRVRSIHDGYAEIARIDRHGEPDGVSLLRLRDIALVYRNDQRQRMAELWHAHRDSLYDRTTA